MGHGDEEDADGGEFGEGVERDWGDVGDRGGKGAPLSRISGIHPLFACGSLRFPFGLLSGRP